MSGLNLYWVNEQIKYNNQKKIVTDKFLKDTFFLKFLNIYIKNKYSLNKLQKKWLAHKAKAKKENWPVANENGK